MIGRTEVDGRRYVIELADAHATLLRVEPIGERLVWHDKQALYNFETGTWDVAEIERVIRHLEQKGLFDMLSTS